MEAVSISETSVYFYEITLLEYQKDVIFRLAAVRILNLISAEFLT